MEYPLRLEVRVILRRDFVYEAQNTGKNRAILCHELDQFT